MMRFIDETASRHGVAPTCNALGVPRATYYRRKRARPAPKPRPAPPRALSPEERAQVLTVLHAPEHVDLAPAQVYAKLLDERGEYLCSERTMYRVLDAAGEVRERRDQLVHPEYKKPELLATAPNQVWSWDITKLLGPVKWTYFYLYVILDIFSRYVVGWIFAERERVLDTAYAAHPERFAKRPTAGSAPNAVWINKPAVDAPQDHAPAAPPVATSEEALQ